MSSAAQRRKKRLREVGSLAEETRLEMREEGRVQEALDDELFVVDDAASKGSKRARPVVEAGDEAVASPDDSRRPQISAGAADDAVARLADGSLVYKPLVREVVQGSRAEARKVDKLVRAPAAVRAVPAPAKFKGSLLGMARDQPRAEATKDLWASESLVLGAGGKAKSGSKVADAAEELDPHALGRKVAGTAGVSAPIGVTPETWVPPGFGKKARRERERREVERLPRGVVAATGASVGELQAALASAPHEVRTSILARRSRAVEAPHPGLSYNPTKDDHEDAMGEAVATELTLERHRQHRESNPLLRSVVEHRKGLDALWDTRIARQEARSAQKAAKRAALEAAEGSLTMRERRRLRKLQAKEAKKAAKKTKGSVASKSGLSKAALEDEESGSEVDGDEEEAALGVGARSEKDEEEEEDDDDDSVSTSSGDSSDEESADDADAEAGVARKAKLAVKKTRKQRRTELRLRSEAVELEKARAERRLLHEIERVPVLLRRQSRAEEKRAAAREQRKQVLLDTIAHAPAARLRAGTVDLERVDPVEVPLPEDLKGSLRTMKPSLSAVHPLQSQVDALVRKDKLDVGRRVRRGMARVKVLRNK